MSDEPIEDDYYDKMLNLNEYFDEVQDDQKKELLEPQLRQIDERYVDKESIGRGGMKKVVNSIDNMTLRKVAKASLLDVKIENRERFIKEARLTASLEHPNIIPVYDLGYKDDEPFFTMRKVEGENLSDKIKSMKDLPSLYNLPELIQIFLKIADAIAFAHDKGVVHLDLKPANVCLGEFGEAIVCDWGLAKIVGSDEQDTCSLDPEIYNDYTLDGLIKGSPGYLAPEQACRELGERDRQTDIYALGGILYSILTLKTPIEYSDIHQCLKDTVEGRIIDPLKINPDTPVSLAAVAMKALSKEKKDRYASVTELKAEVNRWLNGFATQAEDASLLKSLSFLIKRHSLVFSLVSLFFITVIVFSVKLFYKQKEALEYNKRLLVAEEQKRVEAQKRFPLLERVIPTVQGQRDFYQTLEYINDGLKQDPDNEELLNRKVTVLFMSQQFNQVNAFYDSPLKNKVRVPKRTWSVAMKYSQLKADEDFLEPELLWNMLAELSNRSMSRNIFNFAIKYAPDLTYAVDVAAHFFSFLNGKISVETFRQKMKIDNDLIIVDLSGLSELTTIEPLRFLPLKSVDVSNTSVNTLYPIFHNPFEELRILNIDLDNPTEPKQFDSVGKIYLTEGQFPEELLDEIEFISVKNEN